MDVYTRPRVPLRHHQPVSRVANDRIANRRTTTGRITNRRITTMKKKTGLHTYETVHLPRYLLFNHENLSIVAQLLELPTAASFQAHNSIPNLDPPRDQKGQRQPRWHFLPYKRLHQSLSTTIRACPYENGQPCPRGATARTTARSAGTEAVNCIVRGNQCRAW